MVVLNTNLNDIRITHIVDVPHANCSIATARENATNRIRLYLKDSEERIYTRNGVNDTWTEITNTGECFRLKTLIQSAGVPRFTTNNN